MDILKKLNKNTKILNISNCGIKRELSLLEFENLEELYCDNNEISNINHIVQPLKLLSISGSILRNL